MDTLAEMRAAVQSDLTVDSNSTLFTPTTINLAINRAYRKAGAMFPWPDLMDAKKTTTEANQEYYDYPQNWRTLSIWKLLVDGERYGLEPDGSPLSYDDYLNWKLDNSTSDDKVWSNQQRRYFISPTPTTEGLEICIWGIMVTSTLSDDAINTTIFSYSMPEGNEAIILEAEAILKSKGEEEQAGLFRSQEAKQLLSVAWSKIRAEQAKYEKINPFFDTPDLYRPGGASRGSDSSMIGRFNV